MSEKKAFVQSVDRAMQILELFYKSPSLSLVEIASQVSLAKTTAFGLIATLEKKGFLCQDTKSGHYQLGLRFIELAAASAGRANIAQEAARLLKPITSLHGHNGHITVLEGCSVVYVGHVEPNEGPISIKTNVGSRAPAYCTSSGKAFLAHLPVSELDTLLSEKPLVALTDKSLVNIEDLKQHLAIVAKQGYAVDNEESIPGVKGVGIVVCDRNNRPVIGLSVAGLASQFTDDMMGKYVSLLWETGEILRNYIDLQV